jgi:serine/threonine-protein kinase
MIGNKIQNYKVISLLGEGGMGVVYKALDVKLERFIALKILNINTTRFSSLLERFRREARNQARLNHPNIVSVYGFVEEKNVVGIAMEFVEGKTIENIINEAGHFQLHQALDIISQVLEGISYAHSQGFIHRDLKPSNIIIDFYGNAKIMDFGISKSIDEIESVTQHNARPGTLLYMSPEQLSGNEVTVKSDIYALGITLYEMISGLYPFDSKTFYEVVDSHVNKIPPKLSDTLPNVLPEIDEIILKAMGKSSSYNYNSATEFKDDIKNVLASLSFDSYTNQISTNHNLNENSKSVKKISLTGKLANFLLLVIFIVLGISVYFVLEKTLKEKTLENKTNLLNYTQDYSKNPNYIEQTDWQLKPLGIENNLYSIYFINNFSGVIVGSDGLILKSSDGGQNWHKINIKSKADLYSICYVNGRTYCVGENGTVLKSNSNFQIWDRINTNTHETFFDINFVDDNTGFITGSSGVILKSDDGGLTWKKLVSGVKENLFSIAFSDLRTGFAVGWDGAIIKTEDQGKIWSKVQADYKSYLKKIIFINQFLGFIVGGDGLVLRTEDGGSSWEKIDIGTTSGLYKIFFENNEDGIILSNIGEIFKTYDAGKTWRKNNIGKPVTLNDIQELTTGRYIVVGNNGSIFNSKIKVK